MLQDLITYTLDDGQVIKGKMGELTQHQLISLANQFRRNKRSALADSIMRYQHQKFWQASPPPPKRAA